MKRALFLVGVCLTFACSGSPSFGDQDASDDDAGSNDDGASNNDDAASSDDATTSMDSGTKDAAKDSGSVVDTGVDTGLGSVDNSDGFGAARLACINEINKLRATESHKAYTLWDTTAVDTCIDEQATYDQKNNSAHDAWINGVYPTCNGNAQDECLGYGTSPAEVVACLDSMWAERLQSNCSSCASCNGPKLTMAVINCESTTTCDFYGKYGGECGHYLNMSADYFTEAACGFSTVGTKSDWATQNFQ
jgi:hypothetical protein